MPYENEFAHYKSIKRIAENPEVKNLLARIKMAKNIVAPIEPVTVKLSELQPSEWKPDFVLAIDGSFEEVSYDNGYPMTAIGYLTVASVLLDVAKMRRLDASRPIDPKEFRTIEKAGSVDGALPCANATVDNEQDSKSSFRRVLFETFDKNQASGKGETILDTYEILLDYKPKPDLQVCPYDDCLNPNKAFVRKHKEYSCPCLFNRSLFSTDAMRIHESMNPEGSNITILTQTMNVLEKIWVIHFLRTLEQENILQVLQRLAIVVDGPLAVFDSPAWLSNAIKKELERINLAARKALQDENFNIFLIGIEKTGIFMDHLINLDKGRDGSTDALPRQASLLLSDSYIKQRIVFSNSDREYGRNTYFGRKSFYKTRSGALIVFNTPILNENDDDLKRAEINQFPRLADAMFLLDDLVSARYRNSLIPLISANAEAAIPQNLGKRVLEKLAREIMSEILKDKS